MSRSGASNSPASAPEMKGTAVKVLYSWRYLIVLMGLAIAAVLFYAEEDWRGKWAWEKYQRRLQRQGVAREAEAFVPPIVPDDDNFAMTPFLAPLFAFVPGTQHWPGTNTTAFINGFAPRFDAASSLMGTAKSVRSNSWVKPRTDLMRWYAAFQEGTNRAARADTLVLTNASVAEAARGVLEGLAEADAVLEELRQASGRRYSRFNLRYEEENPAAILLPHLAALKHLCQLLQLRASAELVLGQTEAACSDVNLLLYLANATRNEPVLVSHLVRRGEFEMALQPLAEGLADHRWSEPQLGRMQKKLEEINLCADVKHALEGERALLGSAIIESMRRSPEKYQLYLDIADTPGSGSSSLDLRGIAWAMIPSGWFYFEQVNYGQAFQDYLLPAIDGPRRLINSGAAQKVAARIGGLTTGSPFQLFMHHRLFSALLLPGLNGIFPKTAFSQSALTAAATACALERYRQAHGEFPPSLQLLVPEFVTQVPLDVVNGQPLQYRRSTPQSYRLYSLGWNGTDEGGRIPSLKKGEHLNLEQADWVWSPEL